MKIHKTIEINKKKDINCICLTKDNKYIITGSDDKLVRIWNLKDGKCIRELEYHKHYVLSICVTNDGKYIISGGSLGYIAIWNF